MLVRLAQGYEVLSTVVGMARAGNNILSTGQVSLGDAAAFAPGIGYAGGRLLKRLGGWNCFVAGTQVVIRSETGIVVSAGIGPGMGRDPALFALYTIGAGLMLAGSGAAVQRGLRREEEAREIALAELFAEETNPMPHFGEPPPVRSDRIHAVPAALAAAASLYDHWDDAADSVALLDREPDFNVAHPLREWERRSTAPHPPLSAGLVPVEATTGQLQPAAAHAPSGAAAGAVTRRSLFPILPIAAGLLLLICGAFWQATAPSAVPAAASASSQSNYSTRDIETIAVDDEVLAWDEGANQLAWRRVVEVYRRTSDHLRLLDIRNADGSTQRLETTDEHPFYVDGIGCIEAAHLTVGQPFRSPDGRPVELLATAYEPRPNGIPVFNFQVEGLHNYFVCQTASDQPLLVHNADYTPDGVSRITWIDDSPSMGRLARNYEDAATGVRSNVLSLRRQVPVIHRMLPDGTMVPVKFDGFDGVTLIDRKRAVTTFAMSRSQALRQSQALSENGLAGRWEVPTNREADRARRMLHDLGIGNITVSVVP